MVFGLGSPFLSAPADKGGVLIWFTDLIFGYEQFNAASSLRFYSVFSVPSVQNSFQDLTQRTLREDSESTEKSTSSATFDFPLNARRFVFSFMNVR
jgi:hypothetical protein